MEWYWVVAITLLIVWIVSVVLAQFDEDYAIYWACGLLLPVLMVIFYPIRACMRYDQSKNYYEKRGISKLQYLFGKRPEKW